MDNIVEYLVAIIFIISFLSEIFGKKKKKGEKKTTTSYEDDKPIIISHDREELPFEIKLPDIFDIEKAKKKKSNKEYQAFEDSFKKDEEIIKKKRSLIDEYENSFRTEKPVRQPIKKDSKNYSSAEIQAFTKNINNTKEKFFNNESIRDFIIASEILNKPIALRNKCRRIL